MVSLGWLIGFLSPVRDIGLYQGYGFTQLVCALSPVRDIGLYQGYGFTGEIAAVSILEGSLD